jgi:hypothetical protein
MAMVTRAGIRFNVVLNPAGFGMPLAAMLALPVLLILFFSRPLFEVRA